MGTPVIDCAPAPAEGAVSYLIRALTLNCSSIREALEFVYGHSRRNIPHDAAFALAQLTNIPQAWFEHRLPLQVKRDYWREVHLFGKVWRDDWTLRGAHQQVCLQCLAEHGYARLQWDLYAYTACHIHGTVLLDHCSRCGRAISPDRPGLDVCSCGQYLTQEPVPADPFVIAWSELLSDAIDTSSEFIGSNASTPYLLEGLSPDGGYRMLLAFGGGHAVLRGRVLNGVAPWLTTTDLHDVLALALRRLAQPTRLAWAMRFDAQRCAFSLAEQKLRGISPFDRSVTDYLFELLGHASARHQRYHVYHDQLDLFS